MTSKVTSTYNEVKTAERRVPLRHRRVVRYKQNEGVRDTGSAVTATTNEELWGQEKSTKPSLDRKYPSFKASDGLESLS